MNFILTPCTISGGSMDPTLHNNEKVLVWNLFYQPDNEDIIVFDAGTSYYVKRIVAHEDDTILYDVETSRLIVNDNFVEEISIFEYKIIYNSIYDDMKNEPIIFEFKVPKDKVLVLGDNRGNSNDSRDFGFIDEYDILGKVIFRIYPFGKFGVVR
jgi:signal peptidase I